jgi:Putative zinc finger protein
MNSITVDYENSKRFRRNKFVEEDVVTKGAEDEEEWFDEGFGGEGSIAFDNDVTEYDENNPAPTCFSKWFDAKMSRIRTAPPPVQLPKGEIKTPTADHPLKWAKFTNEAEIESTMVVIGRIPITRRRLHSSISEHNGEPIVGTKKKRNFAFGSSKNPIKMSDAVSSVFSSRHRGAASAIVKPQVVKQNQFCFSITKGIECPHYSCTYIHHYSQIEECKYKEECRFALKVDDKLYIRNPEKNGRCTKRHAYECVESYLLRLEIKIYNCTYIVLKVKSDIHSDCNVLRRVLESAKKCCVSQLIWQQRKYDDVFAVQSPQQEEVDDDEEWINRSSLGRSMLFN